MSGVIGPSPRPSEPTGSYEKKIETTDPARTLSVVRDVVKKILSSRPLADSEQPKPIIRTERGLPPKADPFCERSCVIVSFKQESERARFERLYELQTSFPIQYQSQGCTERQIKGIIDQIHREKKQAGIECFSLSDPDGKSTMLIFFKDEETKALFIEKEDAQAQENLRPASPRARAASSAQRVSLRKETLPPRDQTLWIEAQDSTSSQARVVKRLGELGIQATVTIPVIDRTFTVQIAFNTKEDAARFKDKFSLAGFGLTGKEKWYTPPNPPA